MECRLVLTQSFGGRRPETRETTLDVPTEALALATAAALIGAEDERRARRRHRRPALLDIRLERDDGTVLSCDEIRHRAPGARLD